MIGAANVIARSAASPRNAARSALAVYMEVSYLCALKNAGSRTYLDQLGSFGERGSRNVTEFLDQTESFEPEQETILGEVVQSIELVKSQRNIR